MFALIQFYMLFKKEMSPYNPGSKVMAVKFVVFMSFWQSIIVSMLAYYGRLTPIPGWSIDNVASGLQNCILCAEMLIASIWHISAFSYKDFARTNEGKIPLLQGIADVANPVDVFEESMESFVPKKKPKKETNEPAF